MDDIQQSLRAAFEANGYDVGDVTRNRNQVRVVVLAADAGAEDLREITDAALQGEAVLGPNVTTESVDGHDGMQTVVSLRLRS